MLRPKVYRLSFDFKSAQAMLNFWETFQDMNRSGPMAHYDENDWDECCIVHKDTLHDQGKSIKNFLIRNDGDGNGRPIETRTVTRKGLVESLEIL